MADNSEQTPVQTEVTSSEQMVSLVPIQSEGNIELIPNDSEEDLFGSQAIELNGERHVIVSQAQDPETGEILLVLRGENGDHIAIQSDALSSMVQASGGEHIQVAVVSQSDETGLSLAGADITSISQSISAADLDPMPATSLSALPSIIANIPSQTQTTTAPTNVVQAIDTPRVSQEEQPSTISASVVTNASEESVKPMEAIKEESISTVPTIDTLDKKESQPLSSTASMAEKDTTKPALSADDSEAHEPEGTPVTTEAKVVSQPISESKEEKMDTKAPELSKPIEAEAKGTNETLESKQTLPSDQNLEQNLNQNLIEISKQSLTETSNQTLTQTSKQSLADTPKESSEPEKSVEKMETIEQKSESIGLPMSSDAIEEKITTALTTSATETVSTTSASMDTTSADAGFGNTAVIQVQDSGNGTSLEQLMANAMLTSDGNYVFMAQTEDGQVTGLPSEINLSDVINAGAAGGQTFLIETPEGLVACTASTSAEDGSIQLISTESGDIESAVISSAQSTNSVENQIIQAISGGQTMALTLTSNSSGVLELTPVSTTQSQAPTPKPSRARGSRTPKAKAIPSVPSMGQTLLIPSIETPMTESPNVVKPSTPASARSRGGRGGRAGRGGTTQNATNNSNTSVRINVSNSQQLKTNSKPVLSTEPMKSSSSVVNSLSTAPPGPSPQLAASRRTYSKKSNIVWITPDPSHGATSTSFATVATADLSKVTSPQKAMTSVAKSPQTTSRVRTPSPTKQSTAPQTTTSSVEALKPIVSTTLSMGSTQSITLGSIASKGKTNTTSATKSPALKPSVASTGMTEMVATKTMPVKSTTASKVQTQNLSIKSSPSMSKTETKNTIRVSDITATKSSAMVPTPKATATRTVVTVPSGTKTKGSVTKPIVTTIASTTPTVKPLVTTPLSNKITSSSASATSGTKSSLSTTTSSTKSSVPAMSSSSKSSIANTSTKAVPTTPMKSSVPTTSSIKSSVPTTTPSKPTLSTTVTTSVTKPITTSATKPTPLPTPERGSKPTPVSKLSTKTNSISTSVAVKETKTIDTSVVLTPKEVKSNATTVASPANGSNASTGLTVNSDPKVVPTEKTASNRSIETRHSARLSPTKSMKSDLSSDTNKEIVIKAKTPQTSTDSNETKGQTSKQLKSNEKEDLKSKSVLESELKIKSKTITNDKESATVLALKSTKKSDEELDNTVTTDENNSVRKSRRNSRNASNVEKNKKEVKTVSEMKANETKSKDIIERPKEMTEKLRDKTEKHKELTEKSNEKTVEIQLESVSTRRLSRKREINSTANNESSDAMSTPPTVSAPPTIPTPVTPVATSSPQTTSGRVTRASSAGKKADPKPVLEVRDVKTKPEDKDSKNKLEVKDTKTKAEGKDAKDKLEAQVVSKTKGEENDSKSRVEEKDGKKTSSKDMSKSKVESKAETDFDKIVEQTRPQTKAVPKPKADTKQDSTPEPTKEAKDLAIASEMVSSTRSAKKKVKFDVNDRTEEQSDPKTVETSVAQTPESAPTPTRATRRSLRSTTPQTQTKTKSEDETNKSHISETESKTQTQTQTPTPTQNESTISNKTPQRFSTRKRKVVIKSDSIEPEVRPTKSCRKSPKSNINAMNTTESPLIQEKSFESSGSVSTGRLRDRKSKIIKRIEPRIPLRETIRHSIESSEPMGRLNRKKSLIQSYIDEKEWQEKEENLRKKTITSLSDLRSPNECYDYSTNECSFYIRHQTASLNPKQGGGNYLCQKCGFHTTRINNLVVHHRDQCSYIKNAVIQQWQSELQKRVRPNDTSDSASTSVPKTKRRKAETNESNNSFEKNFDESEEDSEEERTGDQNKKEKSDQNPTISDIDAMLMGSDDEDLLSIDNIENPKQEFGFTEDDIVWVETNNTHWPALVSKMFPKEKKALIKYIDSPWSRKSVKTNVSSISPFDSAEVNKKYLRDGRKASNGELLVKAVQKAEEFLRKKCLGSELSGAKFFDHLDSDLSEANADEDERLIVGTSDQMLSNTNETTKTSNEIGPESSLPAVGTSESDPEVGDKAPQTNEAMAHWKEKRRQQNAKLLQSIKDGKVETHLLGVYTETIASERHLKFKSGSESEKNQLKHVPWFGPIDDEEQQEEIYDYCSQLFKTNFKTDGSFDTVAYIFEVWVPEAIVKAISRVRRIELKDSESIFAKGVILSKSEKDELNKEIQKEAEKQLSHTSSD